MGVSSVIQKILDTLTGASVDRALAANAKTAADLKDAVAKARAKVEAERTAKEAAERVAANTGG